MEIRCRKCTLRQRDQRKRKPLLPLHVNSYIQRPLITGNVPLFSRSEQASEQSISSNQTPKITPRNVRTPPFPRSILPAHAFPTHWTSGCQVSVVNCFPCTHDMQYGNTDEPHLPVLPHLRPPLLCASCKTCSSFQHLCFCLCVLGACFRSRNKRHLPHVSQE